MNWHKKYVAWDEPIGRADVDPLYGMVCVARPEDVVAHTRQVDPRYKDLPDSQVLDDFMVVHWAWWTDGDIGVE